jgi:hypothetical protein
MPVIVRAFLPYNVQSITGASGNGITATISFAGPFTAPIGSTVVVAGVTNTGYNGTYIVTGSSSTTVQYLNGTTAPSSGGTMSNTSPGGSVSLTATQTASEYTLTLPAATGTVALTASPTFTGTLTANPITSPAATALSLQSAGTTAITIDTSQNVGVNQTTPATYGKFAVTGSAGTAYVTATGDGLAFSKAGINYIGTATASGYLQILTGAGQAAITIDTNKNVGIGTTSPSTYTTGTVASVSSSAAETTPLVVSNPNDTASTQVTIGFAPSSTLNLAKISAIRTATGGNTSLAFYTYTGSSVSEKMRIDDAGNVGIGLSGSAATSLLTVNGPAAFKAPQTITAATYTVASTDSSLIFSTTNNTLTLPTASTCSGRVLYVKNISANSVVSASTNVVPLGSAGTGTAILAATAGKFAMMQSDGTNWVIMMAN